MEQLCLPPRKYLDKVERECPPRSESLLPRPQFLSSDPQSVPKAYLRNAFVIPQAALTEREEVGDPSENKEQGVKGSQGTRCTTQLCPFDHPSLLRPQEHRARSS